MWTRTLMEHFAIYFRRVLSNSFYPVLQGAIGVGSAFEGWSPREQDVVYQVLIPMTPPRGHSFHLELGTAWQRRLRNFHIRVQQECTCTSEQQGEHMLCFLHHPEEELRRHQDPSLLHTLCTGSYLDVEKTARWFYQLVGEIWPALLESHSWHLVLLPPRRSCQFKVTNGRESYRIEILFGVRQGNSDVFVSSQPRQAHTSSTIWPESYAVAEMKFFMYIARQAPPDSLHLKCLQFFTRLQLGLGFSTYTIKTIVMHLLSILPASQWRRRHFVRRLMDISESLRTCVERRRLNHFIVGNQRLPEGIRLPPEVLMARSRNLFHDLVMDPVAHSQFKETNGRESYWIEILFGVRQGNSDVFVSSQPRQAHTSSTIWPESYAVAEMKFFMYIARRSCQFKETNGRESYWIEILFGVRQGNSDVFVSSQPRQAHTSSTIWPESYAVAEMKFFMYIARRSCQFKVTNGRECYRIEILFGVRQGNSDVFWRRRHFVSRLMDISESLRTCVERRRLNHFIAMNQYMDLHHWFKRILKNEQ
ncbi:inositol 1,4,5-trisphosphate receptor-interacting protein-like 1 [Ammospiza maritima maritima]